MPQKTYPLICTKCHQEYSFSEPLIRCSACHEPLTLPFMRGGHIPQGGKIAHPLFSRYQAFYPYFDDFSVLDLGEGLTPLLSMPELADEAGTDAIYIKNESANPTWSFKDRGTAAGIRRAMQLGFNSIGTVSSGNMGLSVAAYHGRAGLNAFILVSADIADEKLAPIALYTPFLIKVKGDYSELYEESLRLGKELGIYFSNSDEPFRVEGYKTLSYELAEQLCFDMPDYVVAPVSSGGHIRGIYKGFVELQIAGLITDIPTMVAVQPAGCAPIATAHFAGKDTITKADAVHTAAHAIANPYPPSGNALLRDLYAADGLCVTVSDEEMLQAQREIAKCGLFVQMESASAYAAVKRMGQEGRFCGKERVICVATSAGIKYTPVLKEHPARIHETTISKLGGLLKELL